jgi:hypothetical protein
MTVDRLVPTSATPGPVTGDAFMDATAEEIGALWDRSTCFLSSVGGTAADITATLAPALTGSLVNGMRFLLIAAATCTGATTLALNGGAAVPVVDRSGAALTPGVFNSADLLDVVYDASISKYRLLGISAASGPNYQAFTASGTWTKPAGKDANTVVMIEVWGAGGGGGSGTRGGGGGGGGYRRKFMRLSDLTATVSVTIGAGGAVNTAGGNTTFGPYLTAFGGGASNSSTPGGGGGGAGQTAAGGAASGGTGGAGGGMLGGTGSSSSTTPTAGSDGFGGGGGGGGNTASSTGFGVGAVGGNAIDGGGGGGGGSGNGASNNIGGNGGNSLNGGGGGGGGGVTSGGAGGTSTNAGNGGSSGSSGTAPAGGGGRNATGARRSPRVCVLMAAFALIGQDGTILNRIEVDLDEAGQPTAYEPDEGLGLIPDPDGLAHVGGRWSGLGFEPPAEPAIAPRRYSPLEFMDLFTDEEQLAIVRAATPENAPIKLWYDRMLAAEWITTSDERTAAGVNALVTAGLLTADRAAEILV